MNPREVWGRLGAWIRRGRLERQLSQELERHLDLLARDLETEGRSAVEARTEARRRLGNLTALRETSRDAWGFPAVDALQRDLRYALRSLARSPGFTLTVVLTLGLGIGANAAMFAVIDRLMFRPFPHLNDPSTVHGLYFQTSSRDATRTWTTIPYTRFVDISREARSVSQVAAVSEWRLAVGTGPNTTIRKVAGVSASFFGFFDAPPAQGRYFGPAEDETPSGALVAVLSHEYWTGALGGEAVLGRELQIGSLRYRVIGVAPKGFVGVVQGRAPELFVPVTTLPANLDPSSRSTYYTDYRWDWVEMIARRKPGVSEAEAAADLTGAWIRSRQAQRVIAPQLLPDSVSRPRVVAGPVKDAAGPDPGLESRVLLWVTGVAAVVLLIACANVANLMLTRALRRRREIAIRLALGVSRLRLAGQFLIEGLLLATLGAAAGMVAAQWAGTVIRSLLLPEGSSFDLSTDWRTIAVAGVCALLATVVTAIGPAFVALHSSVGPTLKAGAREGTWRRSRLRSALLVTQGALSVVLLVGSGLFVRSLSNVLAIPLGYDATRVLEVYPDFRTLELDSAGLVNVRRRLLAEAERIPGVVAAARVNGRLFGTNTTRLRVAGIDSVERLGRFNMQLTTPRYFEVMQTRILRGRGFTPQDGEGAPPVTVVSAAMARVLWPGEDPLGRCIEVGWGADGIATSPCTLVVGVAEDAAHQGLLDEERFMYYLNVDQVLPGSIARMFLRMANGDMEVQAERVRRALQAVMPGDGFVVVRPLQDAVDDQRRSWRLGATLFTVFGSLAAVVAAVGLYGVMAYGVAQRMHELGVRIALGARSGHIVRMVMLRGVAYAAASVGIGLLLAAFASRWVEPLLYRASPRDPLTYGAVGGLMLVVGVVAGLGPSMRAVRADPNWALRVE
jgi:putative ABC transport system permease protein